MLTFPTFFCGKLFFLRNHEFIWAQIFAMSYEGSEWTWVYNTSASKSRVGKFWWRESSNTLTFKFFFIAESAWAETGGIFDESTEEFQLYSRSTPESIIEKFWWRRSSLIFRIWIFFLWEIVFLSKYEFVYAQTLKIFHEGTKEFYVYNTSAPESIVEKF